MEKKGNSKVIWYILFALITVAMCYLFTVVFFFYISPYNISLKTTLWPFMSDAQIGELYQDAIVDIKFEVEDQENFDQLVEVSTKGVNVRKDGYIVAQFADFMGVSADTEIQIFSKSGRVYGGKLLYADTNSNLTVLKCESLNKDEVKLPFVGIKKVTNEYLIYQNVVAINSASGKAYGGMITDQDLVDSVAREIQGENAVDFVMEYCVLAELGSGFDKGILFDRNGSLIGFSGSSYGLEFKFAPVDAVDLYFDDLVDAYKNNQTYTNKLVESFVGFDAYEVECFMQESSKNTDKTTFYFNGTKQTYTDNIKYFERSGENGYFLFDSLVYNEQTLIEKENVISSVEHNGRNYAINYRADLISVLYNVEKGENITVYYHSIDSLGAQTQSVTFVV